MVFEIRSSGYRDLSIYEESSPSGRLRSLNSLSFPASRFHGKNGWISSGTLPPAIAQCAKYHVSHFRGLSFQSDNVAKIENNVAANRPLQSEPEP